MFRPLHAPLIALALLASLPAPALAQQAEAKAAALDANCKPGKVEVLKRVNGRLSETLYKIVCTGQKTSDGKEVAVTVQCRDRICVTSR